MKIERIIFLDIDGVLNNELMYIEKSQDQRYKENGYPYCDLNKDLIVLLCFSSI